MTLLRTGVVLAGAAVVMLAVVVLRAETTRLHFERSQLERVQEQLRRDLDAKQLELDRLRSPNQIRRQMDRLQGPARGSAGFPADING